MGRKAVEGDVPTEICVAVIWLRWNIGAPLARAIVLHDLLADGRRSAGAGQCLEVAANPIHPWASVRLAFPLSCPIEIGNDLAPADFC
jgi:hypothetical protein